jgi:hypothetical protein
MIANTAFGAALTTFLLVCWIGGELSFLAPYKRALLREHGAFIAGSILIVFLHLCAAYYSLARWLFLRETGRKLAYYDRQLRTEDSVWTDLRHDLESNEPATTVDYVS